MISGQLHSCPFFTVPTFSQNSNPASPPTSQTNILNTFCPMCQTVCYFYLYSVSVIYPRPDPRYYTEMNIVGKTIVQRSPRCDDSCLAYCCHTIKHSCCLHKNNVKVLCSKSLVHRDFYVLAGDSIFNSFSATLMKANKLKANLPVGWVLC